MKKTILFIACISLLGSVFAQRSAVRDWSRQTNFRPVEKQLSKGELQLRLSSVVSSDDFERSGFTYDENHRLIAEHDFYRGEYDVIDSLHYDENGHMVLLSGWQLLNGTRKNVYYINYGYNEQGLISSRENYNFYSGNWELGGIYNYTYNEAGQIIRSELTLGGELFQRVTYQYEDGNLVVELWEDKDFLNGGGFSLSEVLHYYYENGKNTLILDSILGDFAWELNDRYTYAYDANGNMTEYHKYDHSGLETERRVYEYDNRLLENCLMPSHPELFVRPITYTNRNLYIRESYWMADVDHVLQYLCDYLYNYKDINEVGVVSAEKESLSVYPNPTSSMIAFSGLNESVEAVVYDAMGREAMRQSVSGSSNSINVSQLRGGVYIVRLSDGRSTRFVIK